MGKSFEAQFHNYEMMQGAYIAQIYSSLDSQPQQNH
jgi:hypothetical protein